jgi:hypothetical protein
MRTIKTDYGHLDSKSYYLIGVRTRVLNGVPHYYGHVSFPIRGTHKRTKMITNEEGVKTFVTASIKHSMTNDFAFKDSDGIVQWTDFDPNAPTLS